MVNNLPTNTVRDILNIDNTDPFAIDMSEFEELSSSMPLDANLDLAVADKLAQKYLQASNRVSEILSSLIFMTEQAKNNKNKIKAKLFLLAKDEGYSTVAERNAYVESHDDYMEACDKYNRVNTARGFFDLKYEAFLNAHRLMKDKLKTELRHLPSSGYNEVSADKVGEKEW